MLQRIFHQCFWGCHGKILTKICKKLLKLAPIRKSHLLLSYRSQEKLFKKRFFTICAGKQSESIPDASILPTEINAKIPTDADDSAPYAERGLFIHQAGGCRKEVRGSPADTSAAG